MGQFGHRGTRFVATRLHGRAWPVSRREAFDPNVPDIALVCEPRFEGPPDVAAAYLRMFWQAPLTAPPPPESLPPAWAARFEMDHKLPLRTLPGVRCEVGRRRYNPGHWWMHALCADTADGPAEPREVGELAEAIGFGEEDGASIPVDRVLETLWTCEMDEGTKRMLECLYAKVGWIFAIPRVNGRTAGVLAIPDVVFVEEEPDGGEMPPGGTGWSGRVAGFVRRVAPAWAEALGLPEDVAPTFTAAQEADISLGVRLMTIPPAPPDTPEEAGRTAAVNPDIRRVWRTQRLGTEAGDQAVFVEIDFRGTEWVCRLVVDQLWIRALGGRDSYAAYLAMPEAWRGFGPVDLASATAPTYRCVVAPAVEAGRWDVHIETGEGPIVIEPPERPWWHTGPPPPPPPPPAAGHVEPDAVMAWQVDDRGKATLEAVLGGGGWLLVHTRTWRRTHGIMGVTRLEVRGG